MKEIKGIVHSRSHWKNSSVSTKRSPLVEVSGMSLTTIATQWGRAHQEKLTKIFVTFRNFRVIYE